MEDNCGKPMAKTIGIGYYFRPDWEDKMIKRDLSSHKEHFSGYTELRIQQNTNESLTLVDGSIMDNSMTTTSGVSSRVFDKGGWGFASNADFRDNSVKQVISAAADNARFMSSRLNRGSVVLPSRIGQKEWDFSTKKNRVSQKEKIDYMKELDAYVQQNCKGITSRTLVMRNLDMEKNLITSDGSLAYSFVPRALIVVVMTMEQDGSPVELYKVMGGRGQFEDQFVSPEECFQKIDELYSHLKNKKEAVYSKAGYKECVLDSNLAGVLAHEAIGHTTEADIVLGGSVAANYLEKEVASPMVSMIDYAYEAEGEICPVPLYIDDEGVEARDALLIDKGVLKTFMHNKDSAEHFSVEPTGNARAHLFSDEPLIRMRNTAIVPGKDKLDDMIASIEEGYYLMNFNNGQADSTSEFMFGITMGYEIKEGKIGKAIKDTTISGVAFDTLKTIDMISDEMTWSCAGMCGKKQPIPVGMGGPAIKCKINIGGK